MTHKKIDHSEAEKIINKAMASGALIGPGKPVIRSAIKDAWPCSICRVAQHSNMRPALSRNGHGKICSQCGIDEAQAAYVAWAAAKGQG